MRGPRKGMIQQHKYILVSNSSNHPLYISLFVHNLVSKAICSEYEDFVYNCVFQKKEKKYSRNLSHFENENTPQGGITF